MAEVAKKIESKVARPQTTTPFSAPSGFVGIPARRPAK
jgi:hypothetical protein